MTQESVSSRLLGYDARLRPDTYVRTCWDQTRRTNFLLAEDVQWPLSVDPLVWPSVFQSKEGPWHAKLHVWLDLGRMREQLRGHPASGGAVEIAMEILVPSGLMPDQFGSDVLDSTPSPEEIPSGSSFLGYDIADAGYISGLSNCGYAAEEKNRLQGGWPRRLNQYGLFMAVDDAFAFRELTDGRVPEHAPFWVFRLTALDGQREFTVCQ